VEYKGQAELEALRSRAVFDFLVNNQGSTLLSESDRSAIIRTGGMSRSQVKGHIIACLLTVGLWVPAFAMIAILRAPRQVLIHVADDGSVLEFDLDVDE
jgi:hypothetical protein